MTQKKFYITTPIYYPSGNPHIGHAYSTIFADVICRYKTLIGYDAFMQTGMDEHGQKIADVAKEKGISPQKLTDDICKIFLKLWEDLDIHYHSFVRTSDPKHIKVVQEVFKQFQNDGYIYLGEWEGLYCVKCEENYTKSQVTTGEDGEMYCRVGHKISTKKEPSYFFKMSKFESWIKKLYDDYPNFIVPKARMNELTNSFLKEGLEDLSVSRTTITWGIPVLGDEKHKVYVWIDALLNYLTGLGYKQSNDALFQKYWNDPKTEIVHLMSKEITRFHCIYWPIMLHCLNLRQISKTVSHGWIITEQGKMSKSLGNVINPVEYIQNYGSDALRYFLMKEMTIERDGIFSHDKFIECFNADLANNYGNLVSRFIGLVEKYGNGVINKSNKPLDSNAINMLNSIRETITAVQTCAEEMKINELVNNVLLLAKHTNKYIENTKPWVLEKENKIEQIHNFLFCAGNAIRTIVSLLQPILVKGSKLMIAQLKLSDNLLNFDRLTNFDLLNNHHVGKSNPIYMRIK